MGLPFSHTGGRRASSARRTAAAHGAQASGVGGEDITGIFGARRIDAPAATNPLMQPVEWQGRSKGAR
jgi:hypothetical protein